MIIFKYKNTNSVQGPALLINYDYSFRLSRGTRIASFGGNNYAGSAASVISIFSNWIGCFYVLDLPHLLYLFCPAIIVLISLFCQSVFIPSLILRKLKAKTISRLK